MDSSRMAQVVATTGLFIGVATFLVGRKIQYYNRTRRPALMRLINIATERALLAGTLFPIDTYATQLEDGYKVAPPRRTNSTTPAPTSGCEASVALDKCTLDTRSGYKKYAVRV
eukprot:GEMP01062100.1.p1 GENE.GEMP01062100.1~~GEMP01062100.1.p1  ORF type:complete len:123 (+),score=16.95 GEMP01062100.1:30-371(+)